MSQIFFIAGTSTRYDDAFAGRGEGASLFAEGRCSGRLIPPSREEATVRPSTNEQQSGEPTV